MRAKLKEARVAAGFTQEQIAKKLEISVRYYRMIETGERNGDFDIWDTLEDIIGIHQRILREVTPHEIVK